MNKLLLFLCTCFLPAILFSQAGLGLRNLEYRSPVDGYQSLTDSNYLHPKFNFGMHYRWFDAAMTYSGNLRQTELENDNLHDIFNMHAANVTFGYHYNKRLSAYVTAPLLFNQKSSTLEHSLVNGSFVARQRRVTEAIGLGDVFLMVNYTPVLPTMTRKVRVDLGAGVKFPTGNPSVTDTWHNVGPNRTSVTRPVDPVIQLGDDSWGIIVDLRGSYMINSWLGAYGEGRYLATPAATNSVPTFRNTFSEEFAEEGETSVSDQYMARGGLTLGVPGSPVYFSFGIRIDGTPVNDIVGTSEGFRRPGYATTFETSFQIRTPQFTFYLSLPYVYYQVREQSNADKRFTARTGRFRQGDAPFARFALFAGVSSSFYSRYSSN